MKIQTEPEKPECINSCVYRHENTLPGNVKEFLTNWSLFNEKMKKKLINNWGIKYKGADIPSVEIIKSKLQKSFYPSLLNEENMQKAQDLINHTESCEDCRQALEKERFQALQDINFTKESQGMMGGGAGFPLARPLF